MRKFMVALVGLLVVVAVPLAIFELVFRFLPVNSGLGSQPVNAESPVFRFSPNRDFTYSLGWNFALANRGHLNNDGFVNDRDYDASAPGPLMAVIGDSYVEALMVPFADTLQGRLSRELGPRGRIYSFAASGAPLSQYLVWADYARKTYKPSAMAILVVGNDFDESLMAYKDAPGFHYYAPGKDGQLTLTRVDYSRSTVREMAARSALVRYLIFNLQGPERLRLLLAGQQQGGGEYVGNTASGGGEARLAGSKAAVDAFLRDLPAASGLPADKVVLLLDGLRSVDALRPGVEDSYFMRMRAYFTAKAGEAGYEVIDLQPRFLSLSREKGTTFDFGAIDGHWNGEGHAVAAAALRQSRAYRSLFGD